MIKRLLEGLSPGTAAEKAHISRSTAFGWKKADPEFAEKWDAAVETALDNVESRIYARAMSDSPEDARFIMKYRRYDRERADRPLSNFILNVTLDEHNKRLERLGLPVPQIESDLVDEELVVKTLEPGVAATRDP